MPKRPTSVSKPAKKDKPASNPRDTAIRYMNMLSLIPLEPRSISTRELTDKLEEQGHDVELRTVQRDLVSLSHLFMLATEPGTGRENRWFFRKGSPTHWPAMDLDTALAITLAEQDLHKLLPKQIMDGFASVVQQAKCTLDVQDSAGKRKTWASAVRIVPKGFALQPQAIAPDVLANVYEAMGMQRQLRIVKDGKESVINPLGLVMRGAVLYLVCTYYTYTDIRITALHRISEAERQMSDILVPEGFNLDDTLQRGIMHWRLDPDKPKAFELLVNEDVARYLSENRVNDTQTIKPRDDGRALVRFTAEDTIDLRQWLLGFGATIVVNKPAAVKKWIASTADSLSQLYR